MKNIFYRNLVLAPVALSLGACGMLNDMHKSTMDMSKTTSAMNATMTSMAATMVALNKKMDALPEMSSDMKDLGSKMDQMTGRMDLLVEMNQNMKDLRGDIKSMNDKLTAIPEMNQNMKDLRGDIKGMHDDITTLTGKMDLLVNMNQSMGSLLGEIKLMRNTMEVLGTDMQTMTEKMSLLDGMNKSMVQLCSEIKVMSGKMDALPEMKTAMDGLAQKMGLLEKMSTTMSQMLIAMRTVFTAQHRGEVLNNMEKTPDQVAKLGWAAEFMNSQTYQSWNASLDSKETRLKLMALAVPDFFYKVHNYIHDHNIVDVTKQDQQSMNLFAIAATLDYVNSIEMDGLDGSNEPVVSMLSMIEDGLSQKVALNSGKKKIKDLPEYQKFILENEEDAIYLLRVRQNFLKGIVYTLSTSSSNGNTPTMISSVFAILGSRVLNSPVESTVNTKNVAELEIMAHTLDTALETEKFLLSLKVDPMNDKNISALLKGLSLSPLSHPGVGGTAELTHFNRALNAMVALDK